MADNLEIAIRYFSVGIDFARETHRRRRINQRTTPTDSFANGTRGLVSNRRN